MIDYRQLNRYTPQLRHQPLRFPAELILKETSFAPYHDIREAFHQIEMASSYTESQYIDDDVVLMSDECSEFVASSPRLGDSDSSSSSFKFNYSRLRSNLRFPGLMLFLVFCGRVSDLIGSCFVPHESHVDMLDTLGSERSFPCGGRESGVMLDTLKSEGKFGACCRATC